MKKTILSVASLVLALAMLFSLYSCTSVKAEVVDLMENITPKAVEGSAVDDNFKKAHADFSAELFRRSYDGENTLISPLSVALALGMTASGAGGETAEQFCELFGGISPDEMNRYLYSYAAELASDSLNLANSVWMDDREDFTVKESFLQGVADYYGADVYKSKFNSGAVDAVNDWIEEKTDGMIEKMLDEIDPDAVMLLVNTVLFEAKWLEQYNEYQVRDGEFTTKDGEVKKVNMMHSDENIYLESDTATGVMKPYADGKYAFAAALPKDEANFDEFVNSLDGDAVTELLESATYKYVLAAIPEFEYDFGIEMKDILSEMGISDAFNHLKADFTGISDDAHELHIAINRVLHKTRIELTPAGTKAGAATVVELNKQLACADEPETVYLDRPFVYMIVDTETNLPVFIGAVTDIGE